MAAWRGSQKHVLDWVSEPAFKAEFEALLSPTGAVLVENGWKPVGYGNPQEARLESFGPRSWPTGADWSALSDWWLLHKRGAMTPNWDLAAKCTIAGKPGMVLVETKANVPELKLDGKPLRADASQNSRENHEQIRRAIAEAAAALAPHCPGIAIGVDELYQLSNRVAFTWKLASLGLPTILVYLGFTGDEGIRDAGEPFRDDLHWRQVFTGHASRVGVTGLIERRIDCGGTPMWLLVRSRPVLSPSPAAA